jgi:hypothetical protein
LTAGTAPRQVGSTSFNPALRKTILQAGENNVDKYFGQIYSEKSHFIDVAHE